MELLLSKIKGVLNMFLLSEINLIWHPVPKTNILYFILDFFYSVK